ncbi:nitric-oxide reductase large subunit [Ancylomarina salipaludis]|uniref:Nitric-oxide reductase large subunit n=1 Tax=Ancylomarina salipaludis TaxID=2501299 RepID=A0A4Q1JNL1_9BACT|nr:nitric-oxide reductase large subunit [Ancylomarina salipaludis]RXQ95716.1 nitric-oxide reductase large subunit [Ancylomarina salipaludis]
MNARKLWIGLIAVILLSFSVVGYYGYEIYRTAPPIPEKIMTDSGEIIFTKADILDGQNIWQSIGGQEVGSIWGHGAYLAPDWTADWLHKEAIYILNRWSQTEKSKSFESLNEEEQAALKARLKKELRSNTYNETSKVTIISNNRWEAIKNNSKHYTALFTNDPAMDELREAYAVRKNSLYDLEKARKMNAFFFWASWACVTNRPDNDISYTNNWPNEPLVDNEPTGSLMLWSGFSIIMLLIGIALLGFYHANQNKHEELKDTLPQKDPLTGINATPSMKATLKYFWVVSGLIVLQVLFGAVTAHFGVEGDGFFGLSMDNLLPYSVSRTWHVQLGIFWIATSWLATGLYMGPAISGFEPKFQRLGVNVLFGALLVVVLGSMAGQWLGVMQKLGLLENFWFGHMGYEYVDLGRFWQILLFAGLFIWFFLMSRSILPILRKPSENRKILSVFYLSCFAIALLYGAALMWGQHTNLALAEYWRWWVVHLWVEGFFEVFATSVIAILFVRMGMLRLSTATTNVLFSAVIFLSGGIIGTFHHLYFSGTPTAVLALGSSFSALEIVPLVFMGFEIYENVKLSKATDWMLKYKWAIYSFIAVAFWNLVGAGILGFLINPPIALYYMQGLNTTPLHGHTALFGVYGMLGIGLMLFVLRGLSGETVWEDKWLKIAFWSFNIGLVLMMALSVLPIGIAQTFASIKHGMWFARSAEFNQQEYLDVFRWLRVFGDVIFGVGALALVYFIIGIKSGWSIKKN